MQLLRSCQLDSCILEQRFLTLPFFTPVPTKKLCVGGDEMSCLLSKTVPHRDLLLPAKHMYTIATFLLEAYL